MNIIQQARQFVQRLQSLAKREPRDWQRCPYCGGTDTHKNGSYIRRTWFLDGRREVRVQRHWCDTCRRSYKEESPYLTPRGWYAREVRRKGIDLWEHARTSLRRVAEWLRSEIGRQERYRMWRPWEEEPSEEERCYLSASTVHRWLDEAGKRAERSVRGQLEGVATSGKLGTDGLWARLRGGVKRVVLMLVDYVTGIVYPPVVAEGEEREEGWRRLFERAREAGLDWEAIRGVTSDGVNALAGYLAEVLWWVNHQRCVWHLWRNLGGRIGWWASRAAVGLEGEAAKAAQERVRKELTGLIHEVLDAPSWEEGERALKRLAEHPYGKGLAKAVGEQLEGALMHLNRYNEGQGRVSPEWCWRDYRQRLSRGRNHGSEKRQERAGLVWGIYRNFTPGQMRSERKRVYKRAGKSPLEMAGMAIAGVSYLDALEV